MKIHLYICIIYSLLSVPALLSARESFRSEIVESSFYYEIKGNKLIRTDSVVLQINERMGDRDADFGFDYSKGDKVDIVYAQIEDMNGNIIRKLKRSDIKDQSYISHVSFYEDDFIKTFELKHNVYPYRIRYCVKRTSARFLQILSMDFRRQRMPVRKGKITIEVPDENQIKYKQRYLDEPRVMPSNKTTKYVWEYSYIPAQMYETNADYDRAEVPRLLIVPLNYKYGKKGTWKDWETFGNWVYRLNAGRDVLPETEKTKINTLIAGITDNREKAKALFRYLQKEVRYINVKIDIGGLQAYPAEYVCRNRYGDCKALTNYMQSLLKHAGINSYYTLIHSGEKVEDVDMDFPSQVFNHAILTVPFEQDTVFLECTDKNLPFGYVHSRIQGRKALLVKENGSELVDLSSMNPPDVLYSRSIVAELNDVKLSAEQRGEHFEESAFLMTGANKNLVDKYIRNTIFPSGSYNLIDYSIRKTDDDGVEVFFQAHVLMDNIFKKYGNNMVIAPFPISLPNYETPEKRSLGIRIDLPLYYKDSISYIIPENRVVKVPENIHIDTDFGHYELCFSIQDNRLIVWKSLLVLAGRYPLDRYEEFYQFITGIKKAEAKNINIEVI